MQPKSLIERAIELANAGEEIIKIERRLNQEGFSNVAQHLGSPSLRKQLNQLRRAAIGAPPATRGRPSASRTEF